MPTVLNEEISTRPHAPHRDEGRPSAAASAFHMTDPKPDEMRRWSAHHLPEAKAPRGLRPAMVAVAAGLALAVLVTAVTGPIRTAGTQMEPARFQAKVAQGALKGAPSGMQMAQSDR